jgi:cytochrome c biogenesis protein CcdA
MKVSFRFLFLFLIFFLNLASLKPVFASDYSDRIIIFWGQGCPHCAKVEKFIQENGFDKIFEIERKEIYFNQKNREEFNRVCEEHNIPLMERGVPMALIDGNCVIGDQDIIEALKEKANQEAVNLQQESETQFEGQKLTLPLVVGAATVDVINPCAFAVLIILLTTILASQNKRRVLLTGLSFALAIFISYFLMGLGIYRALSSVQLSNLFMKAIGVLALLIGFLNLKDYFWYGKGFLMEVPLSWRPRLKSLIQSVTSPLGAFFIGFLVSLFLLPCTSGPYIVILGMLSQKETFYSALGLLLLYNLIFILPMLLITLGVYKGLDLQKAEDVRQKKIRLLHLIAGLIMIGMGLVILLEMV